MHLATQTRLRQRDSGAPFPHLALRSSIAARFEEQLANHADDVAIAFGSTRRTYREVEALANGIAHQLRSGHGLRNQQVGLLFPTGPDAITAMLGVLKSDNVYVPLEPTHPVDRLSFILQDADCSAVLTTRECYGLTKAITSPSTVFLDVADTAATDDRCPSDARPQDSAYILYTSGSTGRPKGVVQTHENVLHYIRNYTNALGITPPDRLSLVPSYAVAAGMLDIYGALLNGASVFPFDLRAHGWERLIEWLIESKITVYHSAASTFRALLGVLDAYRPVSFPALRVIDLGGDATYPTDVEAYQKYFTNDCWLVDGWGSTEATVALQYWMNNDTRIDSPAVPVGYPVEDTDVTLLDATGYPTDANDGEIGIRTRYVSPGYWKLPAQTAATFVPDPRGGGLRVYRTGDLGRRDRHGAIEYVGRRDFQIKINGLRVETGEIENDLLAISWIAQAAVVAHRDTPDRLTACVVLRPGPHMARAHHELATDVRQRLAAVLPAHMIPRDIVFLDRMPVTDTGKIDRRRLINDPPRASPTILPHYRAPGTGAEDALCQIWRDVLQVPSAGVDDDFFELGGNSIQAVRISVLAGEVDLSITPAQVYQHPTVARLVKAIRVAMDEGEHGLPT